MQHTRAESPGRRLCSCRLPAVAALRRERARMRRTHFATKLIHEHKRRDCRRGRADTHTRNIGGSTSHARHGVNVGPGLCPASPGFTRLHPASRHRASPARLVALWGLAGACPACPACGWVGACADTLRNGQFKSSGCNRHRLSLDD